MISEEEKKSQKTSVFITTEKFTTTVTAENSQWIDWKIKNNKIINLIMFNVISEIDVHIENEMTMKKM